MGKLDNRVIGVIYGLLAYTAWGFLPIYWKLLKSVPAGEILAHRIFWSFIYVAIILFISGNWKKIMVTLSNKKNILLISIAAIIIGLNWFTYIYGVNSNRVVEASMGYYINPLITVLLGVIVLKEKLNYWQVIALILASIGVLIMTISYGKIPWIALTLAFSFAFYSLIKKVIKIDSIVGLMIETAILMPIAFIYIVSQHAQGVGALGNISTTVTILLIGAGIATATPLLWFAKSAKRVELSTIGFMQYIAPTLMLLIGVFVYNEPFSKYDLIGFSFIWSGLAIYTLSKTNLLKSKNKILIEKENSKLVN